MLRKEVLRARASISAETRPPSLVYVPEDPPEGEADEEQAEDEVAGDK